MVLTYQVAADVDDAHEDDNGTNFDAAAGHVFFKSSPTATARYNGGFRFDNVAIAKGTKIQNAYLQVYIQSAAQDEFGAIISAEDANDAVNFSDDADVTTRLASKTSATVTPAAASGFGVGWYVIEGLAAVVEEVVARAGWASGQAIVILCEGRSDISNDGIFAEDYSVPSQAAKLTITTGATDALDLVERYKRLGVHARFAPML